MRPAWWVHICSAQSLWGGLWNFLCLYFREEIGQAGFPIAFLEILKTLSFIELRHCPPLISLKNPPVTRLKVSELYFFSPFPSSLNIHKQSIGIFSGKSCNFRLQETTFSLCSSTSFLEWSFLESFLNPSFREEALSEWDWQWKREGVAGGVWKHPGV